MYVHIEALPSVALFTSIVVEKSATILVKTQLQILSLKNIFI
jgi:hypothetical protein